MFQSHHLGSCGLDFLGLIKNTLPSVEKPFTIWLHEKCNLDACHGTLKTSACFPWSSAFLPRPASPFLLRKHAFVDLSTTEGFPGHPPVSPCFGLTGLTPWLCLAQSVHLQPQRKRITGLTLSTNCSLEPCPVLIWIRCRVSTWCFQTKESGSKQNSLHRVHHYGSYMAEPREEGVLVKEQDPTGTSWDRPLPHSLSLAPLWGT